MRLQSLIEQTYHGKSAAGVIAVRKDGRILLGLRSPFVNEPGTWNVPGGKIETGEDPMSGAQREFREETGYEGNFEQVQLFDTFRDDDFVFHTFACVVEDFHPYVNWENTRFEWVDVHKDIPHPTHFGLKRLWPKIKSSFNAGDRNGSEQN